MSFGTWAKSNWLILVLSGVALAAAPTAYVFSSKMHKNLVADHQAKAQKDLTAFASYQTKYSIPSVRQPDQKAFEAEAPLNKKLIDFFQVRRDSIKAESAKVGSEAAKFNEGEGDNKRVPLVQGVFPKYPPGDKQVRQAAMIRAYTTTAHQEMLKKFGAGMPPDPARIAEELKQAQDIRKAALLSTSGLTQLTQEQEASIKEQLMTERLNAYLRQASTISFYADMKSFPEVPTLDAAPKEPTLAMQWDWQWRYWIHSDIVAAISLANKQRSPGEPEGVPASAVKRLLKVTMEPASFADVLDEIPPSESEVVPTATNPVPVDTSVSITGRRSRPDNQFYDVRVCTVEAVVAPDRLPAFFDALAKTNFMTVLKCDLDDYNPADDLREGYYYGNEHVVKATIAVETLWLRAWTVPYMPEPVKKTLLVLEEKPAAPAEDGGG